MRKTLEWLLEPSNPCVRYRTLTELLGREEGENQVREAQANVMRSRLVARMLGSQKEDGGWDEGPSWYHPKYRASSWRLLLLGQLGVDRRDERIRKACEYAFRFQLPSGAFADRVGDGMEKSWASAAGCLNGNVLTALARLGYARDERVAKGLCWLIAIQENDGGWLCRSWKAHARNTHSCFMGSITALEAINALLPHHDWNAAREAAERACEFLLMHRLYLSDHHGWTVIRHEWTQLGFPYFVNYDILRGLLAVLQRGHLNDPRLLPAIRLLMSRRTPERKWVLDRTYGNMGGSASREGARPANGSHSTR